MEKLIKLLNKYEEDKIKNPKWLDVMYVWKYEWTLYYYNNYKSENVFDNVRYLIISKEYGFVQRLVKHFMFNMTKIDARIALSDFNATDRMLMALAISYNPIELLIDCLK